MITELIVFITGFLAMIFATLSGGGALLIMPVLLLVGLLPQAAVATNRFAIFFQGFGRLPAIKGQLNIGKTIPAIIISLHTIGSAIGAIILLSVSPDFLFKIIGVLLIIGSLLTLYSPKGNEAIQKKDITTKSVIIAAFAFLFLGIYRGFFAPGAGAIGRLLSVHVMGLDFVQAHALATYTTIISSAAALLIFLNAGLVDFAIAIPLAIGAIIGSYIGSKYAISKGRIFMKYGFVAMAIIFGGYFILR